MNILTENRKKILVRFKGNPPLSVQSKDKSFAKEIEAITGLTFKEFSDLLGTCAFELAEAYGLLGREEHLESALKLTQVNEKLSANALI